KLIVTGEPQALVREIGVNTYKHTADTDFSIAEDYWDSTKAYWAAVRNVWTEIETQNRIFGLTIQGEPEELYTEILNLANAVQAGEITVAAAAAGAENIIHRYTTATIGKLKDRLADGHPEKAAY